MTTTMADQDLKQVIATFVIIILALALTPSVASFVTDAKYQAVQDVETIVSADGNYTILTYDARNDSATYAYFRITLDINNVYGVKEVDVTSNITYNVLDKNCSFKTGVLDKAKTYEATIDYWTDDLTSVANVALIAVIPIIWVVVILAVGIVAISYQLKKRGG